MTVAASAIGMSDPDDKAGKPRRRRSSTDPEAATGSLRGWFTRVRDSLVDPD